MTTHRKFGIAILLVWLASLALPVFTTCAPGYDHVGGWMLLLLGWLGLLELMPAWLANFPIVIVALLLFFNRRPPIWLAVLGALLAMTALWWTAWADDTGERPICHHHAGYYLWLADAALALVAAIVIRATKSSAV